MSGTRESRLLFIFWFCKGEDERGGDLDPKGLKGDTD